MQIPDEAVDSAPLIRLSVNLNQETAAALRDLAESAGTATEAVRRAISVYKFLQDEVMRGRKIHIMDSKGSRVREMVFEDDH